MEPSRVAVVQLASTESVPENLAKILGYIKLASHSGAFIVCFPETALYRGSHVGNVENSETINGISIMAIMDAAREHGICVLLPFSEKVAGKSKVYNTVLLIGSDGEVIGAYRKIHLFDVNLPSGKSIRESESFLAGDRPGFFQCNSLNVGIMTCYDLRFPELARILTSKGARVIFVPSNFTSVTGRDHWEVLLRARAIENQVFIVAPNQAGVNAASNVESYGRSMVIDPWGVAVSVMPDGGEVHYVDLNFRKQEELRLSFPVLEHRVF